MSASPSTIQIFDTLSGKKTEFRSIDKNNVRIYGCGPTVYGLTHVGNAFAALTQDLVARVFERAGYTVTFARNITDVDDKIIKAAQDRGISSGEIADEFTTAYLSELKDLGTRPADVLPYATQHIPHMINMIETLVQKEAAYPADTPFGTDVYFRISSFKEYGKLSKRNTEEMLAGSRIEPGESKENPMDFALWKAAKPGEPSWPSPWGEGRPGWHIECSAMIAAHFKNGIDIHMGGLDLIFPHHENEIAQSECCHSTHPLARYWVHNNLLIMGREKMSKSLGNIFTTRSFLDAYGPEVLRLMIFQNHYRSPIDFSEENILRAEALLERLYTCKQKVIENSSVKESSVPLPTELEKLPGLICDALFDDFNSAKALGFVLKTARQCFREDKGTHWKAWGLCLTELNSVLGLLIKDPVLALSEIRSKKLNRLGINEAQAKDIDQKIAARDNLRKEKNFAAADALRAELEKSGIIVMDGLESSSWTLKK